WCGYSNELRRAECFPGCAPLPARWPRRRCYAELRGGAHHTGLRGAAAQSACATCPPSPVWCAGAQPPSCCPVRRHTPARCEHDGPAPEANETDERETPIRAVPPESRSVESSG